MSENSVTEQIVKHTPGPWTVSPNKRMARELGRDRRWREIDMQPSSRRGHHYAAVIVFGVSTSEGSTQMDANARLIAAAPDLLDALKALRQNVDTDLSGWWTESTSNRMQQADAAIAKAEGDL